MADPLANPTPSSPPMSGRTRATPLHARGEPMVWLTGAALVLCVVMIITLLSLVLYNGGAAFWPRPIERVTYTTPDGATKAAMGIRMTEEAYDASATERAAVAALKASGKLPEGAVNAKGDLLRRLYRIGNREVGGQSFVWLPVYQIGSSATPAEAVMLERREWGPWFGTPSGIQVRSTSIVGGTPESIVKTATDADEFGPVKIDRRVVKTQDDGKLVVEESRLIGGSDPAKAMAAFDKYWPLALKRADEIERLNRVEVGRVNHEIESIRLRVKQAALELERAERALDAKAVVSPLLIWGFSLFVLAGSIAGLYFLRTPPAAAGFVAQVSPVRTAFRTACFVVALMSAIFAWVERPTSASRATPEMVAQLKKNFESLKVSADEERGRLEKSYIEIAGLTARLDDEDRQVRAIFIEAASGRFAPIRQTDPGEPMRLSQVIRAVQPNEMSLGEKFGVYVSRWNEFVFGEPREANTEGGIFPVIFGTVLLTILLSVLVVPLGVIAAIYLREYAKQGPLTSAIRIAINNLAGVPSIVYGVFGLGFFCYTVGAYVDKGSGITLTDNASLLGFELPVPAMIAWWAAFGMLVVLVFGGVFFGLFAKPRPGQQPTELQGWVAKFGILAWVGVAVVIALLIATTPYFNGFFEAHAPSPKFAAKGMLWSALTLSLLTLPVVVVATEEAIAAVPRSMREGSVGCGASKWQTIQRIVLPRAMPGIMTGAILAMARGAGEVAPLMLVGAVKLAPENALTAQWPFLHLDRSFMHLGFHIYDVGFQSPDSEAAKPIVWCTTLLLIVVVVTMNTAAVRIRSSLRKKFHGESF
ncbi:MAG: ABC transporter permease subunit [Phycisphaerales bacterium]|nr:ABC transporter permease subunit [Phycisphaerales bacterium]